MATPHNPWKAEYAKSARSSCKTCKSPIEKEVFRLGKMVQAKQFDGVMPMWNHASCLMKKAKQIKSVEDVEGYDALRWDDQQSLRKYIESAELSNASAVASTDGGIEISKSSRAICRVCNEKILKGEVRISIMPEENQGARGIVWNHANCFIKQSPSFVVDKLAGWNNLSDSNKAAVSVHLKSDREEDILKSKDVLDKSISKSERKRKGDHSSDVKARFVKAKGDIPLSGDLPEKVEKMDLESKLEFQSKAMWGLKDDIKKHVTTAELRAMLEVNSQDSTGSEFDLRDRCADGMMFGALPDCPICSGCLSYSGGMYRCHGYISEWSKCSYSTAEPKRVVGKWKIPEGTTNEFLCKWFKSQKVKKPVRVLPATSSNLCSGTGAPSSSSQPADAGKLKDLKVSFIGVPKESIEKWEKEIVGAGGLFHGKIKKDTNCVVVSGVLDDNVEMKKARRLKLPIVRESYLTDCFTKEKKLPFDIYKVESIVEASSMATIRVKGRSSVHESSGLQDTAHILEDGNNIYNTTMNMSDLSTGVNSYYILQLIQEDKGSDCYVFRKWGRVGNDKIGGTKLDEITEEDGIHEFKRIFFEKTGNPWDAWVQKQGFKKQPGRFFPLEIDYGVKQVTPKKISTNSTTQLALPVAELMNILFNVETYRAAMMEFEINMAEMPLGKLSKTNIREGFEALTEIQNLINSNVHDSYVKESLIVDVSNRFFTLIPSVHPHVIRDEDSFKAKVKMLEALQDIELASRLVGFDSDNEDSLDEKYKKLSCAISPLSHDCEDYKLIDKYLHVTHAPTHKDWTLELEEVFSLEREGEFDKFAPHRQKMKNKMLLWHGSRLTNFVGILSQGLRIAPPEAPATGYMFGKGVYFADLVSKSAQYCYTTNTNPIGLMILSEVALGEVHELKNATYMDKPPKGKHSTKGIGKIKPLESDFVTWRDEVVVPCGKPVPSNVKASELAYNEYIVYNTAQVKMQFLVKVKFNHKR